MTDTLFNKINKILAEWNPLDVPKHLIYKEYASYVSNLIITNSNCSKIRAELINIIVNKIGLHYSENNITQNEELDKIAEEISHVF